MKPLLFAAALFLIGLPQGTPQNQTGVIEGRIIRTSTSEPVPGVQISLVPPAAQAPAGPQTQAGQPVPQGQPPQPAPQPQNIQIVRNPDGSQVIQVNGASVATIPPGAAVNPQQLQSLIANVNPGASQQLTAVTDADGKFTFPNLAPGVYTVRAQRQGYFGPMTSQGSYAGGVTSTVTVEANKTARVEMGMVQGGVLKGLLKDPDGQPAANYAVVMARPAYVNGRYLWSLTGAMNADDRGEYRWPNLAPGEYYVGSGPRAPGPIANAQDSWARVFYPGVIDPNKASSVTITEGGETTVNLDAQIKPWGSFKISGIAYNPLPNLVADPATGIVSHAVTALLLMPLDLTPLDNPPVTMWTNLVATNTKPNGEFVLSNVDPGRYELYAMALDMQNRRVWTGQMNVEVRDKDLTGLTISVSPGLTLRGEMTVTGPGAANVKPDTLRFQLQSMGTLPPQVASTVGTISFDPDGKFQIDNLAEGKYRLNVQTPPGAYVASVSQGSTNVFDDGFNLDKQNAQLPIKIEINMAGATIAGNVHASQGKNSGNAVVVLVPASIHRNNPSLYKTGVTDEKGHFTLRGVAPGLYTAYAWESVLPGAYLNSEFLDKYMARGKTINVQGAIQTELELDLIQ